MPLRADSREVVHVEAGDLGDPGAGVERHECDGAIARRRALLGFAQEPHRRARAERLRRSSWQLGPGGAGGSEAVADVQVIDGGEHVVDGRPNLAASVDARNRARGHGLRHSVFSRTVVPRGVVVGTVRHER
jgi:hypothetical protein